jgi:hypothetical protein
MLPLPTVSSAPSSRELTLWDAKTVVQPASATAHIRVGVPTSFIVLEDSTHRTPAPETCPNMMALELPLSQPGIAVISLTMLEIS